MSLDPHDRPGLRPGRQPYDALSGMRVGAAAGGLIGVVGLVLLGVSSFWWVVAAAVIGGAVGYAYESRRARREDGDP